MIPEISPYSIVLTTQKTFLIRTEHIDVMAMLRTDTAGFIAELEDGVALVTDESRSANH